MKPAAVQVEVNAAPATRLTVVVADRFMRTTGVESANATVLPAVAAKPPVFVAGSVADVVLIPE
jgi:hypothetical protein